MENNMSNLPHDHRNHGPHPTERHGHLHKDIFPFPSKSAVDISKAFASKKHLSQDAGLGRDASGDGLLYTCSCHPEIVRPNPGDCPLCGMSLVPLGPATEGGEDRDLKKRTIWGSLLALGAVLPPMAAMIPHLPGASLLTHPYTLYAQGILATAVVFGAGWPLLRRFALSLKTRALNMFTLTGLGTLVAWGFSAVALLFPETIPHGLRHQGPPLYFESAAVITVLVLLGQVLEGRARRKSGDGLKALWDALPQWATVKRGTALTRLSTGAVRLGDVVVVGKGEAIPVDGLVIAGESELYQTNLTGEPFPIAATPGTRVHSGTKNGGGELEIKTEATGKNSLLGQVAAEVTKARQSRTPAQNLADRVSAIFVPAVLIWALVAAAFWAFWGPEPRGLWAATVALSVLLVACPCALGLAIPMAVTAALARGSRSGVLVRDAAGLWALAGADTVVFDKTGTLTKGEPQVASVLPLSEKYGKEQLLSWAAASESFSDHPLAKALVGHWLGHGAARGLDLPPVTRLRQTAGGGIESSVEGHEIVIGQKTFLLAKGILSLEAMESHGAILAHHHVAGMSVDGVLEALFLFEDPLKEGVGAHLKRLKERGLRLVLLSGDRAQAVASMASGFPFDEVHGGKSPLEKAKVIRGHQARGRNVLFAGDGLNDLPGFEAADAAVALGAAASWRGAGVLLPAGDLGALERAIKLSRALRQNSRVNLALAFGYNLLALPLASGALMPFTGWVMSPMVAAALMALSSLSVVLSASTLLKAKL